MRLNSFFKKGITNQVLKSLEQIVQTLEQIHIKQHSKNRFVMLYRRPAEDGGYYLLGMKNLFQVFLATWNGSTERGVERNYK